MPFTTIIIYVIYYATEMPSIKRIGLKLYRGKIVINKRELDCQYFACETTCKVIAPSEFRMHDTFH